MSAPLAIKISWYPYRLVFKEPGGTSRGILKEKLTYFIRIADADNPSKVGYGEVAVFPGLSRETLEDVETALKKLVKRNTFEEAEIIAGSISSVSFGMEQAKASLLGSDTGILFPSSFTEGKNEIIINGLVWMGDFETMVNRAFEKLEAGFSCIKIKIGAINWEDELHLIKMVREKGGPDITIRLDANGAFEPSVCLARLEALAPFNIHSIEQPLRQGLLNEMAEICSRSPIPIALDEELIGLPPGDGRSRLLECINPQYLVLKPALCFGFSGAEDWIRRAVDLNIGWWITSALESSVGLNAIAQFVGTLQHVLPQGLGTGCLFTNNFPSPLYLNGERMLYKGPSEIYYSQLSLLPWKD